MDKSGRRVEAAAEEPDLARRGLEGHRIVVCHRDLEGRAVEMLRPGRAAHGTVVLGAAIGGADDQRLAQPVVQRLQLVEGGLVDQQLAGAPAGGLGWREVRPAQPLSGTSRHWRWKVVVMGSSKTKSPPRGWVRVN
jgi:hypothetical protein